MIIDRMIFEAAESCKFNVRSILMIIECSFCEAKVDATVISKKGYQVRDDDSEPFMIYLLQCPVCSSVIVGGSDLLQISNDKSDWGPPERLWPNPIVTLHYSIPAPSRKSIEEAQRCFHAKAYSACAVMCGRAIEAVCAEHKTKAKLLAGGLKELRDRGIIDQRLFDWAEALREQRNIGAHATGEDVSRVDARDVLDFSIAICEYVFVLSQKYEDFKARHAKKGVKKAVVSPQS